MSGILGHRVLTRYLMDFQQWTLRKVEVIACHNQSNMYQDIRNPHLFYRSEELEMSEDYAYQMLIRFLEEHRTWIEQRYRALNEEHDQLLGIADD